jgi:putative FmdB family regulatory protein
MTYEYACSACGHAWEAEQSISAAPLMECPSCKQATAKRQVSGGAGFILKGGGWYADLYSSGAKKPAEGSETSSSEGKSDDKKSDDKKSADKPKTDTAASGSSTTSSAPSSASSTTATSSSKSTGATSS